MTEYKVSVILPCYNHAQFLPERIRSVLDQTYRVSEIIFLDDASRDESIEVARHLLNDCDIEVRFISNVTNSGSPFSQWNKGIELARYPYIWIAETDDSCENEFLEHLVPCLQKNRSVLAFAQSRYINSEGIDYGSLLENTENLMPGDFVDSFCTPGEMFVRDKMAVINSIPNASAVLFKREAYVNCGKANSGMRYCGDWDLWIRLSRLGDVCFVASELNHFRFHHQTTRAMPITGLIMAEYLACRSLAMAINGQAKPKFDLRIMCQSYRRGGYIYLKSLLSTNRLHKAIDAYRAHKKISNVCEITKGAWVIIFLLVIVRFFDSVSKKVLNAFRSIVSSP